MFEKSPFSLGQTMALLVSGKIKDNMEKLELSKEQLSFLKKVEREYNSTDNFDEENFEQVVIDIFLEKKDEAFCRALFKKLNDNYEFFENFVFVLSDFNAKSLELRES